jgi:hypothetical protein
MSIELRLRALLGLDQPGHTPIKDLAKEMGLSTFQLNSLLNNETPTINRQNLDKVIHYMKDKEIVRAADLPEVLFTYAPSQFWQMISERSRIRLCMGVRWDPTWNANVIMAADSMLQSTLLYGLTGIGDFSEQRDSARDPSHNQIINSQMVPAWVKTRGPANKRVQRKGAELYEEYQAEPNDKALICLGSIKSNPAIEPVISNTFKGLRSFERQDDVQLPEDRGCPFAMIVRPDDPKPPSSSCSTKLSMRDPRKKPGVYFETESGKWEYARCDDNHDVAIVFYRLDRLKENLEMVLGGFSGYSTRLLAQVLRERENTLFWPPIYESANQYIGISIVKFWLRPTTSKKKRAQPEERMEAAEVIDVPRESIERRLDETQR